MIMNLSSPTPNFVVILFIIVSIVAVINIVGVIYLIFRLLRFLLGRRNQFQKDSRSTEKFPSSPTHRESYQVFISFRGADTRLNFTDHLYQTLKRKGIHTFRDDEELRKGKNISPELLKAIEESRFAVVVLSKNFAYSSWCLDELVHIVKSMDEIGQTVFPVFYHVEPSVVRKQTGTFGQAMTVQKKKVQPWRLDSWSKALTEISNLSGWHVKDRPELEVIEEIAKEISDLLRYSFLSMDPNLVGMSPRIKKLESCLDTKSNDVRIIGIWGMAGIGKTTIAREVFKKIRNEFEACCFLADVREVSKMQGLVHLQKLLHHRLLDSNVAIDFPEDGISKIRYRLQSKKVLMILDDVDNEEQMKALIGVNGRFPQLCKGSRVIITSRDKHLLKRYEVSNIYEVKKLNEDESLELLCLEAFKKTHPPDGYIELSKNAVRYSNGLPMALEDLGSVLNIRESKVFSNAVDRQKQELSQKILFRFQVSYDGLSESEKELFLVIACFFNGRDQYLVKKILDGCKLFPYVGIGFLVDKSLVTIERNKLLIHGLLQQMGWHIIQKETCKVHGRRYRMWLHKDALLAESMVTDEVKGILLNLPGKEELHLKSDPFQKMTCLSLLKIRNVKLSGCPNHLSNELRLLEWHEYPSVDMPSNFEPYELVELNMPNSRIEQLWNETLLLQKLLLIDLSHCLYLTKTPDLSQVPNLKGITFEGCKNLSEVHRSIGKLQHLVLLNLKGCESLERFPGPISLKSLVTLILSECSKLKEFPEIVGNMEHLSELYLDGTAIQELPSSMECLTGLVFLSLRKCKHLLSLPTVICRLTSLKCLNLSGCLHLDQLPENIRRLKHLQEFDIGGIPNIEVPSSITCLTNLKLLSFHGCKGMLIGCSVSKGLPVPNLFSGLSSLVSLNLSRCNLEEVPATFGCISLLQFLNLSENNFVRAPDIAQLSELRELHLSKCYKLRLLPQHLPLSLKYLNASNCPLLETYSNVLTIWTSDRGFHFIDCQKSHHRLHPLSILQEHIDIHFPKFIEDQVINRKKFEICFPYSRFPDWCCQRSNGSSASLQLTVEDINSKCMGCVLSVVFNIRQNGTSGDCWEMEGNYCHFDINGCRFESFIDRRGGLYSLCLYLPRRLFLGLLGDANYIKVSVSNNRKDVEVRFSGLLLIMSEQDAYKFAQNLTLSIREQWDFNFPQHCEQLLDEGMKLANFDNGMEIGCNLMAQNNRSNKSPHDTEQSSTSRGTSLSRFFQWYTEYNFRFSFPKSFQKILTSSDSIPAQISTLLHKYGYHLREKPGFREPYSIILHSKQYGTERDSSFTLNYVEIMAEALLCGGNLANWKINLELVLQHFFEIPNCHRWLALSFRGHLISFLKHFDPLSTYNFCFPQKDIPEWFKRQCNASSAAIPLPANLINDDNWKGIVICAAYSLHGHPATIINNLKSTESFKLMCHLKTNRNCLDPVPMLSISTNSLKWLSHHGGFIWLTYVPSLLLKELNEQLDFVEARIYSNYQGFVVYKCAIDLLYQRHVGDLKRSMVQCWTSFFDSRNHDKDLTWCKLSIPEEHMKGFDEDKIYNTCLPATGILDWFVHQIKGSSVAIQVPQDDDWVGLALCAYFSDLQNPIGGENILDADDPHYLIYCLENERESLKLLHDCRTTNTEFKWPHQGEFIWVSYIPRLSLLAAIQTLNRLNQSRDILSASFRSTRQGLLVVKCSLRPVYRHSVEEIKQSCIRMARRPACNRRD